ncbi:hypothetical protein KKG45_09705 [bacterium]|nr:hypothetical protein [bacterium]MBU1073508.1 hypothetical protein [bacterium]MBU1676031.1 hypothetical protein [bacterium]
MRKVVLVGLIAVALFSVASCSRTPTTGERLRAMRAGVWVSEGGAYTIWTDSHYFVVSAAGDSASANIYCGASQVCYTDRGIARKQNLRLRQVGAGGPEIVLDYSMFREGSESAVEEVPLQIDESLFSPGKCVIESGVIYDSVAEVTEEYILLSTCNGDKDKIFNDGRSVYMPSDGGESWWYRIEPR